MVLSKRSVPPIIRDCQPMMDPDLRGRCEPLYLRPTTPVEPDPRAIVEALGFDPTNHHNAAKCPYCNPASAPVEEREP